MIINEAIEIIYDILHHVSPRDPPEEHQALFMAIGALQHIANIRTPGIYPHSACLPFETPITTPP